MFNQSQSAITNQMPKTLLAFGMLCGVSATVTISDQAIAANLNGSYQHVLILSIDGLHAADIADPLLASSLPNILNFEKSGVVYTNAFTTSPSDSFPGTLSYLTGANPQTTGVYYDDSYSRTLTKPIAEGGNTTTIPGTEVLLAENLDKNTAVLSGGGDFGKGSIDTTLLPQDCTSGTCKVVYPYQYNQVNTIFDVAHNAGLYTAFSDKHPAAYTIAEGPTGNAINELYSPEINATQVSVQNGKLVDDPTANNDITKSYNSKPGGDGSLIKAYDDLKVNAILNEINGLDPLGTTKTKVPNLFAMNFQAVSVAQKAAVGGIDNGVPSTVLKDALSHTDSSIGKILDTLKANNLFDSTLVVLTAKHGQSPRLDSAIQVKSSLIPDALTAAGIEVAQATQDDVSLLWLKDQSQTAQATAVLNQLAIDHPEYGIGTVFSGTNQPSGFGDPSKDSRTPDISINVKPGYVYVGKLGNQFKKAEHGGFNVDDTNVALVVGSGGLSSSLKGTTVADKVATTQIAVTALDALGLDPNQLQGAKVEGTQALPGLSNQQVPEPSSVVGLLSIFSLFGISHLYRRVRHQD